MTWSFDCQGCGRTVTVDTSRGVLPTKCDRCDPERAKKREQHNERYDRQRRLLAELAQEPDRVERLGGASRSSVGRAVRLLAHAEGQEATREALLDLAAVSRAWAEKLR